MANWRITAVARNSMMDNLDDSFNGGTAAIFEIYSGTQPANADTALSGNTKLATLTASAVMWGASAAGVLTLASVTDDSSADATGTATFCRMLTQAAGTVVADCDVATSGATITLNTVSIVSGGTVSITAGTLTFAAA